MGRLRSNGQLCDRAREWSSLRIDGELSELESALLDAHLKRCPDCAMFAEDVGALTRALRAAELEPLTAPVVLPRRTRVPLRALQAGAAAALVVAAAGLGSLLGILSSSGGVSSRTPNGVAIVALDDTANSLRAIRRESLIIESKTIPRNRSLGDV